ncbi:hypothetical protein BAUCODRAFT_146357 [Baudoinia panamericana UAMH 10762]|uniref:Uncharacterized protein n=1 Tax=Baudoinia panamericana (strain UAMH 10762) TaxID=717646 RepID=M2MRD9_BAUPA|nr:uncharacterized protein BAUCODRAFT_146357 [Baudoinia panamericana UAMH 10762]EMC99406.1 hypothetical protein BAUCODRAFT_146357 [Baudoinia panamericana UAMH 10762]
MDPPAYTVQPSSGSVTIPTTGSTPKRSIQDLRALILGNAEILKPRGCADPVEVILAKRKVPQASAEELAMEQHYAFLVVRRPKETEITILMKSEPHATVEAALEAMFDRTETIMEDVLLRHGSFATAGCCLACNRAMRPK